MKSTMGRKSFGRRKRTPTCETAETESPYLNWRACPASPRFRPPIHPPTTLFFTTCSSGGGGGAATPFGGNPQIWPAPTPPLYLSNTFWRQVPYSCCDYSSHTHTPTYPPHRLSPRRVGKEITEGVWHSSAANRLGGVAIEPRSHLFPRLAWLQPRSGTRLVGLASWDGCLCSSISRFCPSQLVLSVYLRPACLLACLRRRSFEPSSSPPPFFLLKLL